MKVKISNSHLNDKLERFIIGQDESHSILEFPIKNEKQSSDETLLFLIYHRLAILDFDPNVNDIEILW